MLLHFVGFLVLLSSAGFSYTAKFPTNNRSTFVFGHVVVRKHRKTSNNDSSTILSQSYRSATLRSLYEVKSGDVVWVGHAQTALTQWSFSVATPSSFNQLRARDRCGVKINREQEKKQLACTQNPGM
jgi:hypothetical protein